jgi:hypothetical protein
MSSAIDYTIAEDLWNNDVDFQQAARSIRLSTAKKQISDIVSFLP